ncbi:hypothetical protein L1987_24955 [Smallanthus sonchifolius]|uniref:Uncharacterized protein n=1 Tax=Smallanthus sonchifolius TaxID=185202 RepID=A0ACB9INB5_9ASTR|nr:hypothetical protein L1987_24955 [Smallanthus sonchifolius]
MHKSMDQESKKTVSFREVRIHSEMVRSRLELSPTKSKWHVFMFGFGTGKFPAKMELSDIKKRQLRQQDADTDTLSDGGEDESDRRRSGRKRWWLLIDVFRCGGGYEGEVAVKGLQASFPTLKRFD